MKKYLLLLLLSGCISGYHPQLAMQANDQPKYEADVQDCQSITKARRKAALDDYYSSGAFALGSFGLVGGLIQEASAPEKDYNKSGWAMMDECMTNKGYDIKKSS